MRKDFNSTAGDYAENARRHRRSRRMDVAENILIAGLKVFPNNDLLMVGMGNLYRDTGRDDKALEIFERAFSLHNRSQAAIMGYANFLTTKRHFEKAENIYARLFSLRGEKDLRLLCALGNLYQQAGLKSLSAACFGRATLLPQADDYARGRYTEICYHYPQGYKEREWDKFKTRMAERADKAIVTPKPAPLAQDPAQAEQPFYAGPAWS